MIHAIPGLAEPAWHNLEASQVLLDCAKAVDEEDRLRDTRSALAEEHNRIASEGHSLGADPTVGDLLAALEARDIGAYRDAFSRVSENWNIGIRLDRREGFLSSSE